MHAFYHRSGRGREDGRVPSEGEPSRANRGTGTNLRTVLGDPKTGYDARVFRDRILHAEDTPPPG